MEDLENESEVTAIKFDSETMERFVVSYLLKDRGFFIKIGKDLKTKNWETKTYFTDPKLQFMINYACTYYAHYGVLPTLQNYNIAVDRIKQTKGELLAKSLAATVEEICKKDVSELEPKYLRDETVNFIIQKRAVEATYLNELDIKNGKYDKLQQRMSEAVNVNIDQDLGVSLADADQTLGVIQEVDTDTGMTFGTPALDRILGKPRNGELYVFGGVSGVGKTIHLGNVAVENMKLGKKGVFFSLEVDKKRLSKRLYNSLLGKTGVEISQMSSDDAKAILKEYVDKGGDIRIKNYGANCASCADFENYCKDLYTIYGYKPDYIIIDYILICDTIDGADGDNSYAKFKRVSEEMRNLGLKMDVPVFSAVQINRGGYSEKGGGTKAITTAKDVAESKGIIDTAEIFITINQTDEEKKVSEKDGVGQQRLYISKNRNGPSGEQFPIVIDYNLMRITDGYKKGSAIQKLIV